MIIETDSLNQLRKEIQKLKKQNSKEEIIVKAKTPEFNRKVLENREVNTLLSPEFHNRKDFQKQRDSGLNEFLCKLAKKNNITIGIDLDNLKDLNKKQKAILLARIKQNTMLCKKAKTKITLHSKKSIKKQDASAFMKVMNGDTKLLR